MSFHDAFKKQSTQIDVGGETLTIRALSLKDRDALQRLSREFKDSPSMVDVKMIIMCCDEITVEDEQFLLEEAKPDLVGQIAQEILKVSGLGNTADEEAEKN